MNKTAKKYRSREHAAGQTGGDLDGDRERREVENDSNAEEEAYRIDTVNGGSNDWQNNDENWDTIISSVGQWTECMYNI